LRSIAQISDLHFGRHDTAVADALLMSLREAGCDLVVVSGDLTQRARRHEFALARSFLDRIGRPLLVVPGNHDVPPLYRPISRLLRPLARFDRYVSTDRQPFFVDDEIAVLGLGTARGLAGKNGRVSLEQMAAIRTLLGGLPDRLFKVLVTHHPLAVPTLAAPLQMVGRARRALDAVADAGVHLLLSGHYHRWASGEAPAQVTRQRSVLVVHAGTAVSTRTRGGEANSFNLVRLDGERLEVAVMTWTALDGFAATERARYALRPGGWTVEPAAPVSA
jgi:3',5'-cyclic AMP phosphodiesterase CpdA